MEKIKTLWIFLMIISLLLSAGCAKEIAIPPPRETNIPADAVKMTPETDAMPSVLHSEDFEEPVPFAAVNTAGAEDSPFVPHDRNEFYFVFVPDVSVPIEKQVLDPTIGIYRSEYKDGAWQQPEKVVLQYKDKLSLDGCEYVYGNTMWFCSAREGYTGLHWVEAEWKEGRWQDWKVNDFPTQYDVGELHFTHDWNTVYYHSARGGGSGGHDIWKMEKKDGVWQNPVNVKAVNSEFDEGMPYLNPSEDELWFNRWYQGSPAVFRSKLVDGEWQTPELIVSSFAGEPTLDHEGNLYFVHHYYLDGEMIEADIYIAYRK